MVHYNSLVKTLYWYVVIFFFFKSSLKPQSQILLNLAWIINGNSIKNFMTTGSCWYFRYVELETWVEISLTNPPVVRRDLQYSLTTLQKRLSFLYHGYQHQYTTQHQDWQALLLSQWQKMKVYTKSCLTNIKCPCWWDQFRNLLFIQLRWTIQAKEGL